MELVKEIVKYTGVAECHVLGVNLSREQYKEVSGGKDIGYNPVYARTTPAGFKAVNVVFYLQEKTTGHVFPLTFFLEDRESHTTTNKKRYVNARCQSAVGDFEWFTQYDHRIAFHGEAELLTFIRVYTSSILRWYGNYPDSGVYPLEETQEIFKENYGPINDIVNKYRNLTVGVLTGIRFSEKGEYQDVYNKAFVKGGSVALLSGLEHGTDPALYEADVRDFLKANEGPQKYKHFYGDSYKFQKYSKEKNIIVNTEQAIIMPPEEDELPF